MVKIESVTAEIFLIWTNVTRINVAWTNVTVTVGICSRVTRNLSINQSLIPCIAVIQTNYATDIYRLICGTDTVLVNYRIFRELLLTNYCTDTVFVKL